MSDGSMWWEMDRRFGAASVVMLALKKELSYKAALSVCVHSIPRRQSGALGTEKKDKVVNPGGCSQTGFGLGLSPRDKRSSDIRRELGAL